MVTEYGEHNFTEPEWTSKYRKWIKWVQAADRSSRIDWPRLLIESRKAFPEDTLSDNSNESSSDLEDLPDEIHFNNLE